jgi:ParB-like chromosome segregation protein Spo0J
MKEKLSWHNEKRKVKDLIPHEGNPRQMDERQAGELTKSIQKFNLAEIPAINTDDRIVAGHQRIHVLKRLGRGDEEIEVRVPSRKLTGAEAREYLLRSNRNVGAWDWSLLANFDEKELLGVGFSDEELAMGFGLSDAELESMDMDRLQALQVDPPESVRLKERATVHFDSKEDYDRVKKAVIEKRITADSLVSLL